MNRKTTGDVPDRRTGVHDTGCAYGEFTGTNKRALSPATSMSRRECLRIIHEEMHLYEQRLRSVMSVEIK